MIFDWFLFEHGTVIMLYGFVHPPYMLPAFLNPRVFSMEFIRQKLMVDTEHFLYFEKSTEIKYPWDVGPFTIKNKASLPMIESLLKEMGFFIEPAVNYDPFHLISNRRQALKRKPLEHEDIVVLTPFANWSNYPKETPKDTDMQEDSNYSVRDISSLHPNTSKLISAAENITPLGIHSERTNKPHFSDDMDTKEEDSARNPKKQKIEAEGKIVKATK